MEAYFIVKQPCNTFYNLKSTNMLLRYSVAAPHGLCVLSYLFCFYLNFHKGLVTHIFSADDD